MVANGSLETLHPVLPKESLEALEYPISVKTEVLGENGFTNSITGMIRKHSLKKKSQ